MKATWREPQEYAPGNVGRIAFALARWAVTCLIVGLPLYGVRWSEDSVCGAAGAVAAGAGFLLWVLGYILGLIGSEQRGGARALQISLAILVGFLLYMLLAPVIISLHPGF